MRATTTPEKIREVFSAAGRSREVRWDGLAAYFVAMFRAERDAPLALGREMSKRAARNITRILADVETMSVLSEGIIGKSVDPSKLSEHALRLLNLTAATPPQILTAVDSRSRELASELLEASEPVENLTAGLTAARDLLEAWTDLGETVAGMQELMGSLGDMPPIDIPYLASRISSMLLSAATGVISDRRQNAVDATLLSVALTGLMRRDPVPQVLEGTFSVTPTGLCEPAVNQASKSGPYRVISGVTSTLSATSGQGQQVLNIPDAPSELSFYLGPTAVDGLYHFTLPAGAYSIDMAACVLPGTTVNFTLVQDPVFPLERTLSPTALANAINAAGLAGINAVPTAVPNTNYLQTVRIDCSPPVSGPKGWVTFANPSNAELWDLGFPALTVTPYKNASEIVSALSNLGKFIKASSTRTTLFSGNAGFIFDAKGLGFATAVSISKGTALVTVSGNIVSMGNAILGNPVPEVGDECVLFDGPNWSAHTVTSVENGKFTVDGTISGAPGLATLNPVLEGDDSSTNLSLSIAGRVYHFDKTTDVAHAGNPVLYKILYVELDDHGPQDPNYNLPFTIYQETLTISGKERTTDGHLTIDALGFATEAGFSAVKIRTRASEWLGDFNPGARVGQQVYNGDPVTVQWNNSESRVRSVEAGKLILDPPVEIPAITGTIGINNGGRQEWDELLNSVLLPEFDAVAFERLMVALQASPKDSLVTRMLEMVNSLASQLSQLSQPLEAFRDGDNTATATFSLLRAFQTMGAWNFYDRITKGDLSALLEEPRRASREGDVAAQGGTIGSDINPALQPLEQAVLTSVQFDGR